LSQNRHRAGLRHRPARFAQQRARPRVVRTRIESSQRFGRAERVQELGRLLLILVPSCVAGTARDAFEQRLERVHRGGRYRLVDWRRVHHGRSGRLGERCIIVCFLDDVSEDEAITVTGDGTDEPRTARIVPEGAPDRPDRLRQGAVGHDDVGPDTIEDVAPVYRFMTPLDQEDQQIEIAGDERLLVSVAQEHATTRRQKELTEPIARHAYVFRPTAYRHVAADGQAREIAGETEPPTANSQLPNSPGRQELDVGSWPNVFEHAPRNRLKS
jgi:hypothetical protein